MTAALIAAVFQGLARAQAAPQLPAMTSFNDPIAVGRCLAGENCTGPAPRISGSFEVMPPRDGDNRRQGPPCAAEETIKSAPIALKFEVLTFIQSDFVARCRQAAIDLAPMRDKAFVATATGRSEPFEHAYVKAAATFSAECFTSRRILNHGPLDRAERNFLREHVGLIVNRRDPRRPEARPVCEAARLGRFVVTAQHCLPDGAGKSEQSGGHQTKIGFRFFDRPTVFGLKIRKLGTGVDPAMDPARDYAVLEMIDASGMDEAIQPLTGSVQLFDDFIIATTSVDLRIIQRLNSGLALDFNAAVQIRHNTICRPAHVTPNGIFLHSCFPEGIINAGAPFFQRQRGRLVFVGFQDGKTSSLPQEPLAVCMRGLPNFGVAISPNTLSNALRH